MVQTAMLIVSACFWPVCCAISIRLVPQVTPMPLPLQIPFNNATVIWRSADTILARGYT